MINAYKQGKDLYATIAMGIYKMGYWDCMEHHEDGSPNPEGKKRRTSVKAILLGIMYGRGAAAIAEQIHGTKEEAQKIVDDFYTAFPKVKTWMDQSLADLKKNGYVEDFYGRRRRLPEINLPSYVITLKDPKESTLFNPFINCQDREIEDEKIKKWKNKVQEKIQSSQIAQRNRCMKTGKVWQENDEMSNQYYEQLAAEALKDGIILQANTGRRAQASRQCVNARIQGGAATMTKIAMNKIFRDPELNSYEFKLLIGVHDELIGQCKAEYAEKCADRLCEVMKTCVADIVTTPFKCDPAITIRWYEDEMAHILQDKKASLINEGKTEQEAFDIICQENTEFLTSEITDLLNYKD